MAIKTAIVGCGLIGQRRAAEADTNTNSTVAFVVDINEAIAQRTASSFHCPFSSDWRDAIAADIDIVIIATPNAYLAEVGIAALESGKHVLLEKPMGRNLDEAQRLSAAAARSKKHLKVGFNHRYHPAISRAHELFESGSIGSLINMRFRYGHGGRPGYENEWRGSMELAGGGELTDQGVHILDLANWFAGLPEYVFCMKQTAVWPLSPLEDNAFALLRYEHGAVVNFHSSWTQWKNLFSMEIFGTLGALIVEGLGKSYGVERLTEHRRNLLGGIPETIETVFDEPDHSWSLEWDEFLSAIISGSRYHGTPEDGSSVMNVLAALYESSKTNRAINVSRR